jgi:hypothetical protein
MLSADVYEMFTLATYSIRLEEKHRSGLLMYSHVHIYPLIPYSISVIDVPFSFASRRALTLIHLILHIILHFLDLFLRYVLNCGLLDVIEQTI